jgi:hypothetical protein
VGVGSGAVIPPKGGYLVGDYDSGGCDITRLSRMTWQGKGDAGETDPQHQHDTKSARERCGHGV